MLNLFLLLTMFHLNQPGGDRLLEVYSDDFRNPKFAAQIKELHADESGLKERDLRVVQIIKDEKTDYLFKRKHIKSDFTIILIGKDGGEKYRSKNVLTTKTIFAMVDAMPMRRAESKRNSK